MLEGRIGGHEHRREEIVGVLGAAPHDPPDRLAEEQVRSLDRRVGRDEESWHVDAFADHVHRHEPSGAVGVPAGELVDPRVRAQLVADDDDRLLAGDRPDQSADSARVSAVVTEHQAGRVGNDGAGLAQQGVGVAEHLRQQRRRGIDRRPQPPCVVLGLELVGEGGDHLLLVDTPPERRVDKPEREWSADAVGDSVAVAVDVVGRAAAVLVVADKRDRARVRAKRCAREREPTVRALERRPQSRAPRGEVAGVMDLVERHERRSPEVVREQVRSGGDLLIGHDHAIDVWVPCSVGVAPARIQMQANEVGGVGPLRSERDRRADDNHLLNPCRPGGVTGGERLTRARRRDEQEVTAGRGCLK